MTGGVRPGQTFHDATVQLIIIDGDQAHAWEVTHALVDWDFMGIGPTGRSKASIRMEGELRRQTKHLPQREEIE